jgi:diguanylate cyclase (GGDEF)-like protein
MHALRRHFRLPAKLQESGIGFTIRLVVAFFVAIAVVGALVVQFASHELEESLVDAGKDAHVADATALQRAYAAADGDEDPLEEVDEAISTMAERPDTVEVTLLDGSGVAVISHGRDGDLGEREEASDALRAALAGKVQAAREHESEGVGERFEYLASVVLDGKRYVLEVDQRSSVLENQRSEARNSLLQMGLLGLALGLPLFYFAGARSLARRHRAMVQSATRDPLTGLLNLRTYHGVIDREVALAGRGDLPLTVAVIDIDDFKFENDSKGHRHGDELLKRLAAVLDKGRRGDLAFRLGGDEFALILPHTPLAGACEMLTRVQTDAEERGVKISAGVAQMSSNPDPELLREQADAALYEAKRSGGGIRTFDHEESDGSIVTVDKVRAVRALLLQERVDVAFQPIWNIDQDHILGYEALARPNTADGVLAGPGPAFEVAERIGRAHELDALCRRSIVERASELPDDALLFLNVSPSTLERGALDPDALVRAAAESGLTPERIVIELTERSPARLAPVARQAARLRELGFRLALDDVGAGNAGLEMLRTIPVDFVKVDRSVVVAALDEPAARAVLAAILAFAHERDAFVIAEGIETEQMLEFLRDPGIERKIDGIPGAQGYLLGRPSATVSVPAAF